MDVLTQIESENLHLFFNVFRWLVLGFLAVGLLREFVSEGSMLEKKTAIASTLTLSFVTVIFGYSLNVICCRGV